MEAAAKTYLVTGGAGFIGSHFVQHVLAELPAARVVCADALTYAGSLARLQSALASPRFRFVQANVCDAEAMRALMAEERPAYVVHFAAESSVDRSYAHEAEFWRTNVDGTRTLLEAWASAGAGERFLHVSTDEVYGPAPAAAEPFPESAPFAPTSPYAASKAEAEREVARLAAERGLPVNITRSCNNFGPGQHPEKLIPRVIKRALAHEPVPVYGSGEQARTWLYAPDHCRAIMRVLRAGTPGEAYNVATASELTNLQLIRLILAELRTLTADERITEALIANVPDRPNHDARYRISCAKLHALGWRPQADFAAALRSTVASYL